MNNTGALLGFIVASIVGGGVVLKKIMGVIKLGDNSVRAEVAATERLLDLLTAERNDKATLQLLLDAANERTMAINEEKNSLVRELGEIRSQLARLEVEVRLLRGGSFDEV